MSALRTPEMALSALGAVVFALATDPVDLTPATWLGMAGLYVALRGASPESPRGRLEGAGRGLVFGFVLNAFAFRFIPGTIVRFSPVPWVGALVALALLAVAEGFVWAATAWVTVRCARLGMPRPLAFAIGCFAGTLVPQIFPWTAAGVLAHDPVWVQGARLVGERGMTAVIGLGAALLAELALGVREKARARALVFGGASILLLGLIWLDGRMRMAGVDQAVAHARPVRVGLVQPATGATVRWDPERAPAILANLRRLTKAAEEEGAELTIWPESAYPYPLWNGAARAPIGAQAVLGSGVRGPILFGTITRSRDGSENYNSAVVVEPDGALGPPTSKVHLLWFGETVPFADVWPWIRRTFARGLGLSPGRGFVRQDVGEVHAAVLNCFEDVLPAATIETAGLGPNVLVNVTNDAWFGDTSEGMMHLRFSKMRAIESGRELVRAVNLGPSAVIDPTGRVRVLDTDRAPHARVANVFVLDGPMAPYATRGDGPSILLILLAVAVFAIRRRIRRRKLAHAKA